MDDARGTTLGPGGLRPGLGVAGLLAAAAAAAAWWAPAGPGGFLVGYLALGAAVTAWTVVRHRGDRVRLEDDAVVVVHRGTSTAYPWAEVLEASWSRASWPLPGSGPVLRVRGGAYDEPGPNSPAQVASLPLFGRRAGTRARRDFEAAALAHGVPFTPGLVELIGSGRRGPRLPGERRDARGGSL
ncbi:hypothetical protein [Kineococcus sp. SYSU DK001]|uniref:hypothetical protein n=1 Tax=Kineococcus sp. SYSU DK001 TaxID=3383122 RepID=UPI003D7C6466